MSTDDEPLVTSTEAARLLGMSPRTIQRYVSDGKIKPDLVLASGQYRWNLRRLREQINAMREN